MAVLPSHLKTVKKLLVSNGFISGSHIDKYTLNKSKKEWVKKDGSEVDGDHADAEVAEEVNAPASGSYSETDFPKPGRRYRIVVESANATIEEPYYWILEHTRQDQATPFVEKIIDTYSASEQSSFWGAAQSRLGIQQDRAAQYMKTIHDMVKQGLFQMVRELRILDEKLEPRNSWGKKNEKGEMPTAPDLTLKAEYTDLVENRGGQMQPGSIYHLSQTVGYTTLPDMFFNTRVYKLDDVDKKIDEQWKNFNTNVKQVLKRKLYAFVNWKLKTDMELQNRRNFTLKYLRQHWNTIRMYMNWVKPYLRNVQRMQMNPQELDSPDLIGAFETSIIEIEILGYRKPGKANVSQCILYTFKYRTRPDLSFQKDQYAHKGPIHIGRVEISMRAYGWTPDQIEAYKNYRRQEEMEMLGMMDVTLKDAMDALGGDLEKYLSEAGEKEFREKKEAEEAAKKNDDEKARRQSENALDPFISIFKGFGEIGESLIGQTSFGGGKGPSKAPSAKEIAKESAKQAGAAGKTMYQVYKNFKKGHGLLSW
jgi:hypothetical protein